MPIDFAAPIWFILFLLIPFLVGIKLWSRQNSTRGVNRFVAKRLQASLVHRAPPLMDWIQYSLQLLALALFITAMARPQWGTIEKETLIEGRNVMIAIDTSRSMLAADVPPNRIERAKLAAQDLVRNLETDRVGVIGFAGEAFVQAPLTVDHEAVLETLDQLDTEVIPRGGTNLTAPALLALETLEEGESSLGALIIFSDGEDHEGEGQLTEFTLRAAQSDLTVISVGVGTEAGTIIPDPDSEQEGVFIRDEEGEIVRSRLNPDALRKLSELTDGIYLNMGSSSSVSDIVGQALSQLEVQELAADNRELPIDRYYIFVAAALVFLMLSFIWPMTPARLHRIPPAATALIAGVIVWLGAFVPGADAQGPLVRQSDPDNPPSIPQSANSPAAQPEAEPEPDLAATISGDPRSALQMYEDGDFVKAMIRYEEEIAAADPLQRGKLKLGLGTAAYQSGDYEMAKHVYSEVLLSRSRGLQESAHFNLGATLFETGREMIDGVANPDQEA
ncbi:MAG: VWA domain-containing protein, partial [Verrucomicrobiota bacterium]